MKIIQRRTISFKEVSHIYHACVSFRNTLFFAMDMVDRHEEEFPFEIDITIRKETKNEEG